MATVDFRKNAVRAFGYPQACITCGNDEDGQLVSHELAKTSSGRAGCACILFFFGPLGWLLALLLAASMQKKTDLRLPVCQLCRKGSRHLGFRCGAFLFLAGGLFFADVTGYTPSGWGLTVCGLIGLYAMAEYFWLQRQFEVKVLKLSDDGVVVHVCNEEYPALYQRHLDNALLYGSSDTLGTSSSEAAV